MREGTAKCLLRLLAGAYAAVLQRAMSTGLAIWLGLVAVSFAATALDVLGHPNRDMPNMNAVWPLMALYFGPLGVLGILLVQCSGSKDPWIKDI